MNTSSFREEALQSVFPQVADNASTYGVLVPDASVQKPGWKLTPKRHPDGTPPASGRARLNSKMNPAALRRAPPPALQAEVCPSDSPVGIQNRPQSPNPKSSIGSARSL